MRLTVTSAGGLAARTAGSCTNFPCRTKTVVTRSCQPSFGCGQNAKFVVNPNVVVGGIAPLHVIQRCLFMDVL